MPIMDLISKTYNSFATINQQGLIINMGISITIIGTFIFSIPYILTVFYFTKDIELLLPLPFKPYEILGAKFVTVLIYQYLTEVLFLVPFLGVYGYKSSAGVGYWIIAIMIFLILPVIPLVLASLFNMIIMRFTNLGKHKDTLRIIGGIFSIVLFLSINLLRSNGSSQGKTLELVALGNNSLIKIMNSIVPITKWSTYSLTAKSTSEIVLNLGLFILVSILFIIIFMMVAHKLYLKGVIGGSETFSKRKELNNEQIEKSTKQRSKFKAYLLKEINVLFRNPVSLLNCVIPNLIFPMILIIGMYTNIDSYFSKSTISAFFSNKEVAGIVIIIIFAIFLSLSSRNMIASTSISREGQNMYINKYIPISYREQIISKILPDIIMNMISALLILLILVSMIKIPIIIGIIIFIMSLLASIISAGLGIIKEINNPVLDWDNEQKAVKQNKNAISNFFICLILSGLIIFLAIKFNPSMIISLISIITFSLVVIVAIFYYLFTIGEEKYSKIS